MVQGGFNTSEGEKSPFGFQIIVHVGAKSDHHHDVPMLNGTLTSFLSEWEFRSLPCSILRNESLHYIRGSRENIYGVRGLVLYSQEVRLGKKLTIATVYNGTIAEVPCGL